MNYYKFIFTINAIIKNTSKRLQFWKIESKIKRPENNDFILNIIVLCLCLRFHKY